MKERNVTISIILIFSLVCYISISQIKDDIKAVFSERIDDNTVFIIDAGHGGEDSGAIAADGTLEKDINLEIALKLATFFDIFGIDYVMIRSEDISVGDTALETIRKRKVSDINRRHEIINSYNDSVLLSIHQNYFPDKKYYGCQVFYSDNIPESEILANLIQQNIIASLQESNTRKVKASDDSIFLLHKAERPSVMIECGFLSNENELIQLKDSLYQSNLAYFITSAVIDYNNQSEDD